MTTRYLRGEKIARKIRKQVKNKVGLMQKLPKLASILASENPGICQYVESQKKLCEKVGIEFELHSLPKNASQQQLISLVQSLNHNSEVTGILVLLPLPPSVQPEIVQQAIAPEKDVEGVTPHNLGKLFYGDFTIVPCTAKAIWMLLQSTGVPLAGKEMVVVSQSRIVGAPLVLIALRSEDLPTVTCCHKKTEDIGYHVRKADIVVVAAGMPGLITGNMLKPGAMVIDVGRTEVVLEGKHRLVGDVDTESVWGIAKLLTPVRGGVGMITTSVLLDNLINLAQLQKQPNS